MPVPIIRQDIRIELPGPEVRDHEVDRSTGRLVWTSGGAMNALRVARIDERGRVTDVSEPLGPTRNEFFPNQAEWGLLPNGRVGAYFNGPQPSESLAAQVYSLDPAMPLTLFSTRLVLDLSVGGVGPDHPGGESAYFMDAWEELGSPSPLVLVDAVRIGYGALDPEEAQLKVFDPTGDWLGRGPGAVVVVPNFQFFVSSTTGRVIRVVPQFPAVVMAYYITTPFGITSHWRLRWQELNDVSGPQIGPLGERYLDFPGTYAVSEYVVRGVGVERLSNTRYIFSHAYFVYVIKRNRITQTDSIDFHIFDYDPSGVRASRVDRSGTADFTPRTDGPAGNLGVTYDNIGDDESYEDPDGNPCIALAAVVRRGGEPGDASRDPGVICVLTYFGPGPSDWSITTLTPPDLARHPLAARKDPEAYIGEDGGTKRVFIFNRQLLPDGTWQLHRTLAWEP